MKGGMTLKAQPDQRAVILGQYILENKATVRAAAKKFGISRSAVSMRIKKMKILALEIKELCLDMPQMKQKNYSH